MPVNHDLDANAGPSKPSRSPTSERTFTGVDCKDQPDDQLPQGKRERKDQTQGQRKRKAPFRASRSPDWEQEEGCGTGPAIHRKGEGLPKITSLILDFCQLPQQQAESLEETSKRMQRGAKLLEYYSLQAEINESLRKAHLQEAEKHANASIECTKLTRALRYKNGEKILSKIKNSRLRTRYGQLARQNKRLSSRYMKLYGSFLAQDWCIKESQITINAKDKQIEHYESSAREKDGKTPQRGNSTEESDTTVQRMENLTLQMSDLKKQQQEINTTLNRMILALDKNQQETKMALADSTCVVDARSREQENYIYHDDEPIRTSDASLPVMSGPYFSARGSFPATYQHEILEQASSDDGVCFEPLGPSYNEPMSSSDDTYRIRRPLSLTSSLRSQDFEGFS